MALSVPPWVRRAWPVARIVLGFGVAAAALWALYGHGEELQPSLVDHIHWWWVPVAFVLEMASMVAFAIMQQRLLAAGGVLAPAAPLTGVTFASQAISNSIPGGPALAAIYGFRWYRRFGADDAVAGWALLGVVIGLSLSLALVAGAGVALAAELGASLDLVWVVVAVLVLAGAATVMFMYERPLLAVTDWCLRWSRAVTGRRYPNEAAAARVMGFVRRLVAVPLTWRSMGSVVGWGAGNWLLDCGCFAISFLVIGAGIPFKGLLLAYGAGQLAANLPITPGGLGAVEGSIEIALVLFGGNRVASVEAVFVYRLLSFWLVLVIGWVWCGGLAIGVRRGRWPRQVRPTATPPRREAALAAEVEA